MDKKPAGRPTVHTKQLEDEIIFRMFDGESLREICRDSHMPNRSTVYHWIAQDRDGFSDRYEKALMARAFHWADELVDIADDASNDYTEKQLKDGTNMLVIDKEHVQRSRLRIDTRKWLLSKLVPRFADKQAPESDDDESLEPKEIVIQVVDARKGDADR